MKQPPSSRNVVIKKSSRRRIDKASNHDVSNTKALLEWVSRDGLDPAVHFMISEEGVARLSGKAWRTTRDAGRALGWAVLLGGLLSGQSGWTGWGPTKHWLQSKSQDGQLMRWKDVRKIDSDKEKRTISLYGRGDTELRLCCTPDTFEPALQVVRERFTDRPSKKRKK